MLRFDSNIILQAPKWPLDWMGLPDTGTNQIQMTSHQVQSSRHARRPLQSEDRAWISPHEGRDALHPPGRKKRYLRQFEPGRKKRYLRQFELPRRKHALYMRRWPLFIFLDSTQGRSCVNDLHQELFKAAKRSVHAQRKTQRTQHTRDTRAHTTPSNR